MEYTVRLNNFSGPMDLLLYLIKQEELEIHEISLSAVCDKYLEHIRSMKNLDVNVSAEFLVVAATLMVIKSRSLLPHEEELDLDEELDPEDELIQQLLEYKKFKAASRDLVEMADLRSRIYPYVPPRLEGSEDEVPLEDIDLIDLVRAFAKLLSETRLDRLPRLIRNDKAIREYIEEVFAILQTQRRVAFYDIFADTRDRDTVVGRFIALLELTKRGRVAISQNGCYDTIEIELLSDRELSQTDLDQMEADMTAPPIEIDAESGLDAETSAPASTTPQEARRDGSSNVEASDGETTDDPYADDESPEDEVRDEGTLLERLERARALSSASVESDSAELNGNEETCAEQNPADSLASEALSVEPVAAKPKKQRAEPDERAFEAN